MLDAYEQGVAVNDLAAQFQVHRDTVFEHLKRQQVRRRRPPLDAGQLEEVIKLYVAGVPVTVLVWALRESRDLRSLKVALS